MRFSRTLAAALCIAATAATAVARTESTPAVSLERLKAGNARFVADPAAALSIDADKRQAQLKGQSPFAVILSCADSRVPPEVIFNAGLGELFIVRTAGEVVDRSVLASIEYAAEHLHTPLLVVMGHESCGAVKAAVESKAGGPSMGPNLDAMIAAIKPAFNRMSAAADEAHLKEAVLANVEQVVNDVLGKSAIVKHLVAEGGIQLVGAYYELASGRVYFSEAVARPAESGRTEADAHR